MEGDNSFGITTHGKTAEVEVYADTLAVECHACSVDGLNRELPDGLSRIRLYFTTPSTQLFTSSDHALVLYAEPLSDLASFERLDADGIVFAQGSTTELQTSVTHGELTFPGLGRPGVLIRSGDFVSIGKRDRLEVSKLTFQGGLIDLIINGEVDNLRIGSLEHRLNQLPSILEWIYSKHRFVLFLNTFILVVTTIIALLQRFKWLPSAEVEN
jgi:hypothetical protein